MKRCATATAVLIYEVCASLFSTGILQLDFVELPSSYDEIQQLALWPSSSLQLEASSASKEYLQNISDEMEILGQNRETQVRVCQSAATLGFQTEVCPALGF